jgi:hypothetical protein
MPLPPELSVHIQFVIPPGVLDPIETWVRHFVPGKGTVVRLTGGKVYRILEQVWGIHPENILQQLCVCVIEEIPE